MTISLSDLKAKRAAMTPGELTVHDEYIKHAKGTFAMCVDINHIGDSEQNAAGIVATHNAADALLEIAQAALELVGDTTRRGDGYTPEWSALVAALAKVTL